MAQKELVRHREGGDKVNAAIRVHAVDGEGTGGAHHQYTVEVPNVDKSYTGYTVAFHDGSEAQKKAAGEVNGTTHEVLLAIVEHRLECFQKGPFACEENARALDAVREALAVLHNRTKSRMARGVEGQHVA